MSRSVLCKGIGHRSRCGTGMENMPSVAKVSNIHLILTLLCSYVRSYCCKYLCCNASKSFECAKRIRQLHSKASSKVGIEKVIVWFQWFETKYSFKEINFAYTIIPRAKITRTCFSVSPLDSLYNFPSRNWHFLSHIVFTHLCFIYLIKHCSLCFAHVRETLRSILLHSSVRIVLSARNSSEILQK